MVGPGSEAIPRRDRLAVDRTMLAHERTFLAYVRTAFALIGGGVAFMYLFEQLWVTVLGAICLPFGLLLLLKGIRRQRQVRRSDLERD